MFELRKVMTLFFVLLFLTPGLARGPVPGHFAPTEGQRPGLFRMVPVDWRITDPDRGPPPKADVPAPGQEAPPAIQRPTPEPKAAPAPQPEKAAPAPGAPQPEKGGPGEEKH